ncbi:UNVERIFIED_ORG: DNA-binding transcriptional LysR family regulator [Rhizobium esperanzae]|uniref:LysR family transcriptional regulator protein n=1 Tax=Rhizobium phaseoli TaxID=396 RepID=A0ABM6C5J6_9HYPH|nr:LysR family transcriptional regulator [Rhizobium phaseoli]MDH6647662.1 DNA-binding transcriptional LysR family regulator [Rhizobium esperanzae]ANL39077.1 LysR family transcriptional regulator protein [Rhizobium phaseoli]ANL51843.1 LysR family transcriptional regulator protein [Rhizobium phaseoli]ANL58066.1 LysR family transcriptional regulator protein [Rhizobium phaseoli]ANL83457.1 LysR family transcriptional regulator protein [Rhizobium phaseoli]
MLDGLSLDQLRTFICAADEGSFSAAARRLGRAQSAVSELVRSLEIQLGVTLFDRSGRYPRLTAAGSRLLSTAREVVAKVDSFKSQAIGMAAGLEPELSVAIDVFFPIHIIAEAAKDFRQQFPEVPLRLFVEALGGTVQPILDQRAGFGIVGSLPAMPAGILTEPLAGVTFLVVAAADHPLAAIGGTISRAELAKHVQLVLTDRTELSRGREFGVMSPQTWRLADLFAKHTFLLNGLGWGGMPEHAVRADIAAGRLVELAVEDISAGGLRLPMSAAYRSDAPPGPAGRWLIERLKICSGGQAN